MIYGANDDNNKDSPPAEMCNEYARLQIELLNHYFNTMTGRAPQLLPSRTAYGGRMTLSRHHIIPRTLLVAFAGTAIEAVDLRDETTSHFMGLINRNEGPALRGPYANSSRRNQRLTTAERISMFILDIFEWLPGNIFYGPPPSLRGDDPGSQLEWALPIVGQEHFARLTNLYMAMYNFTKDPDYRNIRTYNFVMRELEYLANLEPFEFYEGNWFRDRHGKYHIVTPHHNKRIAPLAMYAIYEAVLVASSAVYYLLSTRIVTTAHGQRPKTCFNYEVYKYLRNNNIL